MRTLGRWMQIAGMIVLPVSMVLELTGGLTRAFGVSDMVKMLIAGAALFCLGRLIEGYSAR